MQSVLQVDGHLFPGNRQLKVWRPRHPQIGRRIRVVVEHLHANLCTRTSVADLARSVNMSRWRFCHLFKIEMSQSPSHYKNFCGLTPTEFRRRLNLSQP